MRYDAFISYSHSADSELAPSLEEGLEQFAKPTFKRSALRIFRDANDLSASPNLWGTIEAGLAASDYFIFMASPRAAQSKWCQKEVEYWKTHKQVDHFLVVLTEGELVWDDAKQDFDWEKTTALPPNLSGVFENEPLFVDFRERPAALSLDDPDFQQKIVLLAATIHGRTIEDMIGEGVRQHKRTIRIRNTAIVLLSLLFVSALLLGVYALQQQSVAEANAQRANEKAEEAQRQTLLAEKQANQALAKNYLLGSKQNLDVDPTLAMKLAVHAYQFAKQRGMELKDFKEQLIAAFYHTTHFYNETEPFELDEAFVALPFPTTTNGCTLRIKGMHELVLEDPSRGRISVRLPTNIVVSEVERFTFSPDDRYIVVFFRHYYAKNIGEGLLIISRDGKLIAEVQTVDEMLDRITLEPPSIRTSADGKRILVKSERQTIVLEDRGSSSFRKTVLAEYQPFSRVDISPDGKVVALGNLTGDIELIRLHETREYQSRFRSYLDGHRGEPITALSFTADNKYLLTQSEHIKRKWKIDGRLPFVQMEFTPSQFEKRNETLGGEGRILMAEAAGARAPEHITYLSPSGDTLAVFLENEDFSQNFKRGDRIVNGDYYVNPQGMYNADNEQLIALDLSPSFLGRGYFEACGFSTDGKYLFAKDRIYFLDAEEIISRFSNTDHFGHLPPFSGQEREDYLIDGEE